MEEDYEAQKGGCQWKNLRRQRELKSKLGFIDIQTVTTNSAAATTTITATATYCLQQQQHAPPAVAER